MRSYCIILWLALLSLTCTITSAEILSFTSSKNLITGENCYVTFAIETNETSPISPRIEVTKALFQIYSTRLSVQHGKRYFILTYRFNAPQTGTYTIPATTFFYEEKNLTSTPITIKVRDKSTLTLQNVESKSISSPTAPIRKTYPYYTQLITEKTSLFPNEATELEYKIYIPKSIKVSQWGLPTGEKKNATAWRFVTPDERIINGDAIINGKKYQVGRFITTVSGINPGTATIGPFKSRIVHNKSIIMPRTGFKNETQAIHPISRPISLTILPLPPNPPANFKGDVGSFNMAAHIETKAEINTSESIKAQITITGKGKFSELTPPSLTNAKHWKLISQTKRDLGKQRKNIHSSAEFNYLIQPKNTITPGPNNTPGFSFSYLDPVLKKYKTLSHTGAPIKITAIKETSSTNTSHTTTTQNKNKPLSIIENPQTINTPWYKKLPLSLIHIIPASICLTLLIIAAIQKHRAIKLKNSHKIIQRNSIKKLETLEDETFIKAASNYIQRWIDTDKNPELKDVITLRDQKCYQPKSSTPLTNKRKQQIINTLKKLTIILCFITPQITEASPEKLWKRGKYQKALTEYQTKLPTTSPDIIYNIGNCHHKLNQPTKAAANYHQAILLDPYHNRAIHNLAILHKQHNSIIPKAPTKQGPIQDWVTLLNKKTYYITLSISLWFTLISILIMKILKPKRKNTIITLATLSALTAIISSSAHIIHPDTNQLNDLPLAIISAPTPITHQPIPDSTQILTIPLLSPCHIISSRGTYAYIILADETQGWVMSKNLTKIEKPHQ